MPSPASRLRAGLRRSPGRVLLAAAVLIAGVAAAVAALAISPGPPGRGLPAGTRFYVPPQAPDAASQIAALRQAGRSGDAALVAAMESVPHAVWLTGGTPSGAAGQVRSTVRAARAGGTVPILVAYDIPGRDCGHYSAGGAADLAAYEAWADGVAAGLGQDKAIVLVEPDALGILPSGCAKRSLAARFTDADRFAELRHAVSAFERDPRAHVYLTASAWVPAGTMAGRLLGAGVAHGQGFFLNVSDFEPTPQVTEYGTWVSECIAMARDRGNPVDGHPEGCAGAIATTHFVVDTSRNGQGYDTMSRYAAPPYNQPARVIDNLVANRWCNPPGAGLGQRPTASTGVPLVDAYLWVKSPGASDGRCDAAGGARAWDYASYDGSGWPRGARARSRFDPLWGVTDPDAGDWFPAQALRLARQASPPLSS